MKKIAFIFLFIFTCSVNGYAQEDLTFVQKDSHLPILIGADTTTNWVYQISFPLIFQIVKNTSDTLKFVHANYYYNPLISKKHSGGWMAGGVTYNYMNKKAEDFEEKDPAWFLKGVSSQTYVYLTNHSPSNDLLQQAVFAPYLQKMREQKVTKMEIESIQDLKAENSKLLDIFLKGDSIGFLFKDRRFLYRENIPVEVK